MGEFNPSARRAPPESAQNTALKDALRAKCPKLNSCPRIQRDSDCACYLEFSARYMLTLGCFPARHVSLEDQRWQVSFPDTADSIASYEHSIDQALSGGWSSVIHGPTGCGKTALATFLAKIAMKYEIMDAYKPDRTRATYFTKQEYKDWQRRLADFRRNPEDLDYMEGALSGSVLIWDDVDPELACDLLFVSDLKKRMGKNLITHVILSQDPKIYAGSPLAAVLDFRASDEGLRVGAEAFTSLGLTGRIMVRSGWAK